MDRFGQPKTASTQDSCCKATLKTLGWLLLVILLYPFLLVFFTPVMVPYILVARQRGTCAKITFAILGFILGLVLIPIWAVACVLYTLFLIARRALALCGCDSCALCCGADSPEVHRHFEV